MVNRLYRDGREWTRPNPSWPGGTRGWRCLAGRVLLEVHGSGCKASSSELWRWEANHQDSGRATLDGRADTREAAMDAAIAAAEAVQDHVNAPDVRAAPEGAAL